MSGKNKNWDGGAWDSDAFTGTALAVRCYESHPVVTLGKGLLYGGSARAPKVLDADVYVVLQAGDLIGRQSDPWEKTIRHEVYYHIQDMDAPTNVARFKKLVTWVCTQLQDGKRVHVGCIGGHGRTGTVLSAIVAELLGEKDAIQYVRTHYCKKAVESKVQVAFLMKHYGVASAEPTKVWAPPEKGQQKAWSWGKDSAWAKAQNPPETKVPRVGRSAKSYVSMPSARSLWKGKKRVN